MLDLGKRSVTSEILNKSVILQYETLQEAGALENKNNLDQ